MYNATIPTGANSTSTDGLTITEPILSWEKSSIVGPKKIALDNKAHFTFYPKDQNGNTYTAILDGMLAARYITPKGKEETSHILYSHSEPGTYETGDYNFTTPGNWTIEVGLADDASKYTKTLLYVEQLDPDIMKGHAAVPNEIHLKTNQSSFKFDYYSNATTFRDRSKRFILCMRGNTWPFFYDETISNVKFTWLGQDHYQVEVPCDYLEGTATPFYKLLVQYIGPLHGASYSDASQEFRVVFDPT